MEAFRSFGEKLEAAWRNTNHSEAHFPALAAEHLRQEDLPSKVDPWQILEWGLKQTELPRQKDINSNFGDPAITLYTSPKFHVDVYFWFEGTTSIHQHGFCGAFQVLHGSSIHSWYDFELKEKINVFTEIGDIKLKVCELLEKGAVQEIWPGRRYIHGLFHLDSPSVTICVRTDKSPLEPPQFNYLKPSLAVDPFFKEETQAKKMQLLSALIRANRPDADEQIEALLAESDFQSTNSILNLLRRAVHGDHIDRLFELSDPVQKFDSFVEVARKRHGDKITALIDSFSHADKVEEILRRRSIITDAEHRFFFALLLNIDGKEQIFALINQRYPEVEPIDKVLDWVFDLSQTRVAGTQQNGLGIEPFDDLDLSIFEHLLRGKPADEIGSLIESEYPPERFVEIKDELAGRIEKIEKAVIFGPLFS